MIDDKAAWSIMYKALMNALKADPKTFQMIYPYIAWDWDVVSTGYTDVRQWQFCNMMPQWSAIGQYISSNDGFSDAYGTLLNNIVADTTDPQLRQELDDDSNELTQRKNDYDTKLKQARDEYKEIAVDNKPTFLEWLADPYGGASWKKVLDPLNNRLTEAQKVYDADVKKAQTPGLTEAINNFNEPSYRTKIQGTEYKDSPSVPAWNINKSYLKWVQEIKARGGTPLNVSFEINNAAYDYQDTWAKGSASIERLFWEVQVNGQWEKITEFSSEENISAQLNFAATETLPITTGAWYNGGFVKQVRRGPFTRNVSAYKSDENAWMWGNGGIMPLTKTAMVVGYQPSITVKLSQSAISSFLQKWKAATGLRIGPFTFGGETGQTTEKWNKNTEGNSITATSTSEIPVIIGINIQEINPQNV
jgi:PIN domain nuclease of toxin-antitoxin system